MNVFGSTKRVFKGTAIFHIKKQKITAFKNEVLKIIPPTRQEAGCITYEAYQVLDEAGKPTNVFEFHETWSSREAMLIEHKENAPHMKTFFDAVRIGTPHSWVEKVEISGHYAEVL